MSGGSYDYLFTKSPEDLLSYEGSLESMANRLAGLGYATDAAREAEDLLLIVRQVRNRLQARMDRLSGIFRAVEWWDSCDSTEEVVHKALAEYRKAGAL